MASTKWTQPMSDIREWMVEDGNKLHIRQRQTGLESFLDENAALATVAPEAHGDAKFRLAGRIPMVIAQTWAKECGAAIGTQEFGQHVKRKLADGTFAKLRVKGF
jgi:hypothetical protein